MPVVLLLVLAVVLATVGAGGSGSAQTDGQNPTSGGTADGDAGGEPPLRDLPRAEAELSEARLQLAQLQQDLRDAETDLAATQDRLQELTGEEAGLEKLRAEQHALIVQRYMAGSNLEVTAFVIGVADELDATWRNTIVSEFFTAVDEAVGSPLTPTEERDRLQQRASETRDHITARRDALAPARQTVSQAEFVVSIAQIHADADENLNRSSRVDPSPEQWAALRFCETREDYDAATGNSYYGAYQFGVLTWASVGGVGNPAHAPPEEQDARARLLYSRRGDQPWPNCGICLIRDPSLYQLCSREPDL